MSTTVPRLGRRHGRHRRRKPEKRHLAAGARGQHRCATPEKRHIAASVALVGASVITGASVLPPPPPAPLPSELRVASAEVRLSAASSVFNIPANLLIDLINIPHNEVRALDYAAKAFIWSGPWIVVGPTNIWGVDPGDPPKFMSLINLMVPFPALSGMDRDQFDQTGLGQQVWHFLAAEVPVSKYCEANFCPPNVPLSPITGIALLDQNIWNVMLLTGGVRFPLVYNLFQVPLSDLTSGYTFDPAVYPGYANPSGQVYPGFGFAGTTLDPVTGEHLMPWTNTTFTLDLSKPLESYFNHLMADPSSNPIQLPDLEEFGRALQAFAAAQVVAFVPITPGSFLCPGDCSYLPAELDYPGIVRSIGNLWPGNSVIDEWLAAYDNGTANVPTQEQIDGAIKINQQGFWSFGNPSPPPELFPGFNPSTLAPFFHSLWTALGLNPPPLEEDPFEDPDTLDAPGPASELRAARNVSEEKPSEQTPTDATTLNPNSDPAAPDEQVTNNASTEVQQNDQSSTPAVIEAPSDSAPNSADPTDDQILITDMIRDGNKAVPGRGGGNGPRSRGGLSDALRSTTDQISSSISRVISGLTGGTKTGNTDTGGSNTGEGSTGGSNSGE